MTLSLNLAQLALLLTPDGAGNVLAKQSPTLGDNSLKLATTAYVVGGFAPLVSPVFSGTPQGTTAPLGDNSTRLATTAYVNTTLLSASGIALSGANVTLTSSQYGVLIIKLTGTLTTNVSVTFPTSGRWEVYNTCTMGGFTITLTNGVGANVAITSQGAYTVLSDASAGMLQTNSTASGSDTTVTQAASDNSTKLATTAYVQTAISGVRGRNRVINGDCRVQQRAATAVTGSANTYGQVDRFCGSMSGSNGQYTLSASTITYGGVVRPCVLATCNTPPSAITGSSYWAGVDQFFEGQNVFDLVGQPISVSFIFQSNTTGTFSVSLRDNATTNSYTTTFAATANTPLKVSFTAPANNSLSIANDSSSRFSIMIGGLNTGTFSASTLNAWTTGGNFFSATTVTNWASAANNYIAIAELQVEAASADSF